ncbi:hypothetical protein F7U74_00125 [Vibrio vulnificus]|nr:hypothetical protein [Vibrio vulnificus]EGQ9312645.1 hypothetical protein [Vibrio vulnificus]EGR0232880.1 hypothetical protein [Vibrio vulnificus]EKA7355651.1 hypothetical protein [Vibrio vulnificus]EKD8801772.1 hypothetical protein [Vibrio vulnificus]
MKEVRKVKTVAPVRCGGKSLELNTELVVGQDLKLSEARSLVSLRKAEWVMSEEEESEDGDE